MQNLKLINKLRIVSFFILVLFWGRLVEAENTGPEALKNQPVQPTMHKIFQQMKDLFPYMINEEKFVDAKNNKVIQDSLKKLVEYAKETQHAKELKGTTFKISQQTLQNHFSEVERIFRLGNKSYARWQLNSTVPLCMSCHTQSPTTSKHWDLVDLANAQMNDFEKAELFFMGRDFASAMKYYTSAMNGYPDNKILPQQLEKAFERKVVVYSRVTRDFTGGIHDLSKDLKNKNIPPYMKKNVEAWIALFRLQNRKGYPNPKTTTDEKLKKYVESELKNPLWDDMTNASNPRYVKFLTVSGILYEYLNLHPKTPLKPEILNWLAICDRQLQETLFYSLADFYLKECMQEYAKHPAAKKCYEEYKANTILSYSGSSGTHLPGDVEKDLKDWSLKVYGVDKSKVIDE